MTHKEIHQRLPDYVLGLLTPGQAHEVAQHLANCTACRRTVHVEREIGTLVRDTLNATTRPEAVRLRQLMPPVPQKKREGAIAANWTVRLAPALVILFIIVGSLLMSAPDSKRPMSFFFAATATATTTNTPTATIAQETGIESDGVPAATERVTTGMPVSEIKTSAQIVAAPTPLQSPTPVPAIDRTVTN